ncbi:MAG: HlyD family efflux transporter periplasmic adaptor subunit [Oligoflexales bacterium]|nr:HlyD family efflux transporter periplasmic adaptor subunit [Oligoflexales bacterium]
MRNLIFGTFIFLVSSAFFAWILVSDPREPIRGEVTAAKISASSRITGRIEDIKVKEGDRVLAGDLLLELDRPDFAPKDPSGTEESRMPLMPRHAGGEINSPVNGEVFSIRGKKGELIPRGYPIITIIDPNNLWITFNVTEDYLKSMKMGTTFSAKVPELSDDKYRFRINFISRAGDYAGAGKTKGGYDLKTYEVRAVPVVPIRGLRAGMSIILDLADISLSILG